jgi:hypothetical protein
MRWFDFAQLDLEPDVLDAAIKWVKSSPLLAFFMSNFPLFVMILSPKREGISSLQRQSHDIDHCLQDNLLLYLFGRAIPSIE